MKNGLSTILLFSLLHMLAYAGYASTVQLPKTGQNSCYDTTGAEIACAGTGQDGDMKAGVAWPVPRFVDNLDGTVTDNLTGLVWLKNASCFGVLNWESALIKANTLAGNNTQCNLNDGSVTGEWRLPNISELESLVDAGQALPAMVVTEGSPFGSVQNSFYWSSSTYSYAVDPNYDYGPSFAWYLDMSDGYVGPGNKDSIHYVWLVRDSKTGTGQFAKVQLPQTGQTGCWSSNGSPVVCGGTGQDGDKLKGTVWPDPRFTDNGNGTVTDTLTGLIWLKDANCFGVQSWQNALVSVKTLQGNNSICSLNDGSLAGDWRLPNRKEMQSLIDHQNSFPALPAAHPFMNVQFSADYAIYYWSSSSVKNAGDNSWFVDMFDGWVNFDPKIDDQYIWPVRGSIAPVIAEGESVAVSISKNGKPTAFSLTLNATDAENDTLTWTVSNSASHGTASAGGSGASVTVSYIPMADYVGQDSFTVQVSDGKWGLDSIIVNVTVNQTYIVGTAVTGNGNITPSAPQSFNSGTFTTFAIEPGTGSYIAGVSGCGGTLSGNSYATGLIAGDCTVSADFKLTQVKVPGNSVRTDYNTLQEAYQNPATLSDMTMQVRINTFVENLILDRTIDVKIKGGYDPNFQATSDYSIVQGSVSIISGSLTVDGVVIR